MPVTSKINNQAALIRKDPVNTLALSSHGIATVAMNSLQQANSLRVVVRKYMALSSLFTAVNVVIAVIYQSPQVPI